MKSLISLWAVQANELGALCGVDARRDILTMSRRCEKEGDAFFGITLTSLGKAFDQALAAERWSPHLVTGFRHRKGLPVFLGGFLANIFTPMGALRHDVCLESIIALRQLTTVLGKIEGETSPRRKRAAIADYCAADDECYEWDIQSWEGLTEELSEVSSRSVVPMLAEADYKVKFDELMPKHGPGQTADRLVGNSKYDMSYWPGHLESRFPWIEWGVPNYRYAARENAVSSFEVEERHPEPTLKSHVVFARQTLVPKTMSAPRVIVMEPTSIQWMQQALLAVMVESIEKRTNLVGFNDQLSNRLMARRGSILGSLVTLDLKEASDRVTYLQAAAVFSPFPNLWEALDATRSSEVELAEGAGYRTVHKFASMGSATCFPVEAVVFLTAILMAIRIHHRKADPGFDLTWHFVRKLEGRVRVYGDDCIFPVEYLPEVERVFHFLGWKINRSKTFSTGNFRESCGGDYWRGCDVTPVRLKRPIPTARRQIAEVQSLVSFRNRCYLAGFWKTVRHVDEILHKLLGDLFPIVLDTSPALGRTSVSFEPRQLGTDRYQRSLTRAWKVREVIPRNECSEFGALLKCLLITGYDEKHLSRSGRPADVSMNRRWTPTH